MTRIVLLGATGYTGRMVVERLLARGERPVVAGRSTARLEELAGRHGGLETREADVARPGTVIDLLGEGDVLVSTVGPFAAHGAEAVRAAIAAGGIYLDSTGEPAFIRRVFEEFGPPAGRAGAALLTAMGYDFVPGALAGALALDEAGDAAVRVDVGYYAFGAGPAAFSGGTKRSAVGVALDGSHAYRDGRVSGARTAARVRAFEVRGRERPAVSIGGSEHYGLPAAYPRLREVNVYLGWFGPLARVPAARRAVRAAGERLVALTPDPQPGTSAGARSWIVAEAYDAGGARLATVHVSGADPYEFTGAFLAWAAQRAARQGVSGTGALGPVEAFGVDALEAGCREAELERTAAGA